METQAEIEDPIESSSSVKTTGPENAEDSAMAEVIECECGVTVCLCQ